MTTSTQPTPQDRFPTIDEDLLSEVCDRITEACQPEAIILIGSAATETTHRQSDIDLVIVKHLQQGNSPWEEARDIHRLFRGWRVPMDIIVVTPEEFSRGQTLPGHIARTADREGKVLYEQPA